MAQREAPPAQWALNGWLSYHLAIVPIGTVLATWLLLGFTAKAWLWWSSQNDLLLAGQVAPFAAVVYGTTAFLVERTGRYGWTLIQFISRMIGRTDEIAREAHDKGFDSGQQVGFQMGREQGLEEGILLGQQQSRPNG